MYDLFFLSHDEPIAEKHWQILHQAQPHARRVNGIDGILNAHRQCAREARTSNFFVVDADNEMLPEMDFSIRIPDYDKGYVHIWRAKNPVNGLIYGWGGIKLFPRKLLLNKEQMPLDMTTSFELKIVEVLGSITHFNTSPFDTWRSAFREAVKLGSSHDPEARKRLDIWCSVAEGSFADFCLLGARMGRSYALDHYQDREAIMKINDWQWLKEQFESL